MIKQTLSENIANKEQIHSNIKSRQSGRRIPLVACLLVLSVGFGAFFILNQNRELKGNSYSSIKMFDYGNLLYFTDARKDDKLYSYNPALKEIKTVIDESVNEFYINDEYYFYINKSGFYSQNRKTLEKYRIADSACEINEYQNSIYFVENRNEEIKNPQDDRNIIGQEKWVTVYRFDIATNILNMIKNDYHLDNYMEASDNPNRYKDISIQNLTIIQDKIYYRNEKTVYCLSLDGKQEDIIYTSVGGIAWLDFMGDKFYYIEAIGWSGPAPVDVEQDTGCFFNTINLKGEKINSYKMSFDDYHQLEVTGMHYDYQTNSYLVLRDNELVRFSFENPQKYTDAAKVERTKNMNTVNIITINGSIFISTYYDAVASRSGCKSNEDYYIMTVNENGELIIAIKNGKVV